MTSCDSNNEDKQAADQAAFCYYNSSDCDKDARAVDVRMEDVSRILDQAQKPEMHVEDDSNCGEMVVYGEAMPVFSAALHRLAPQHIAEQHGTQSMVYSVKCAAPAIEIPIVDYADHFSDSTMTTRKATRCSDSNVSGYTMTTLKATRCSDSNVSRP